MADLVLFYFDGDLILGVTHETMRKKNDILIVNPLINLSTTEKFSQRIFWYISYSNLLYCDDLNYDSEWAMFVTATEFTMQQGVILPAQAISVEVDTDHPWACPQAFLLGEKRKAYIAMPVVVKEFRSIVAEERMKLTHDGR